ncbi:MAG: MFS transporter, partial [Actinomycetota bacterium]|nr:MFS transporter [Actinomycetota bacterium]
MSGEEATDLAFPVPLLARDRAVQVWVGASFVSFAGDNVFLIGFAWSAVHEAAPAVAGLVIGIGTLPQALVMLFGGALADRLDTRRIVLAANVVRVLVLVAGAVAWQSGAPRLPLMVAVATAFGITDAIYNPANATLP